MNKTEKKNKEKPSNVIDPYDSINRRLDAVIRVLVETLEDKKSEKFNKGGITRMLNSAGLTPTEIADILGKKGPTSVARDLYYKKSVSKKKKSAKSSDEKQGTPQTP